ncbi:MAG: chitobiase/beta-hexosaminidase C-terminal domain-containing protein, partial [Spirochaetota bacterium]
LHHAGPGIDALLDFILEEPIPLPALEEVDISITETDDDAHLKVVLSTVYPDGTIRYTLDGSTPNDTSPVFTTPLILDYKPVTVRAYVSVPDFRRSVISTESRDMYVSSPTIEPYTGDYFKPVTVTIASSDPDSVIYYSLKDGQSLVYSGPFEVAESHTAVDVRAWASREGWHDSRKIRQTYSFPLFGKESTTVAVPEGMPIYGNKYYPQRSLFLQESVVRRQTDCLLVYGTKGRKWELYSQVTFEKDERLRDFNVGGDENIFCLTTKRGKTNDDILSFYLINSDTRYTVNTRFYAYEGEDQKWLEESFLVSPSGYTLSVLVKEGIYYNVRFYLLLLSIENHVWVHHLHELPDPDFNSENSDKKNRQSWFENSPEERIFISDDGSKIAVGTVSRLHLFTKKDKGWKHESKESGWVSDVGQYSGIAHVGEDGVTSKEYYLLEQKKNDNDAEYYRYMAGDDERVILIRRTAAR